MSEINLTGVITADPALGGGGLLPSGPRGPEGPEGPQGPQGPEGPEGPEGKQGPAGEQGPAGGQGPPPDHEWDGTEIQFEKPDGSMGEKVDLQGKDGEPGKDGDPGDPGIDGKGWTGGSYDDETGKVTFTSTDGLGFVTGDIRGSDATATPVINRLDSTSTTAALSAWQGNLLNFKMSRVSSFVDPSMTIIDESAMMDGGEYGYYFIFPKMTWDFVSETISDELNNAILSMQWKWLPWSGLFGPGLPPSTISKPTEITIIAMDVNGTFVAVGAPSFPTLGRGILVPNFPRAGILELRAYGAIYYSNDD